jgi:putative endonuclease
MSKLSTINLTALMLADAAQRKAVQARRRKLKRKTMQTRTSSDPPAPDQPCVAPALPLRSAPQQLGDVYERRAWEALRQAGCRLLGRQLSCPLGELDLVVQEGKILVFVEVRYRSTSQFGGALASISPIKQVRLLRAVQWWLPTLVRTHFAGRTPECRIDLIIFEQDTLRWYRDAVCLSQDK